MRDEGRAAGAARMAGGPTLVLACVAALPLAAQDRPVPAAPVAPLFDSHEPIELELRAPIAALRDDRRESPDRRAILRVAGADGDRPIEATVRTRGEFRLQNCAFPPLRLDIRASTAAGTVFEGQDELKLVSSCRPGRGSYEELVHLEYLVYRSYGVVTDTSFRVRLLRVRFVDDADGSEAEPRWAFLIEDDEPLAERLGTRRFDLEEGRRLPPGAFDPLVLTQTGIFQYMVGNHDWSATAGHNVEILDRGGVAVPVPYDFDFSGVVDAPYATPPAEYRLDSVRQRYYRGWCANPVTTGLALQSFREARTSILEIWATSPGLGDGTRRRAIRYLGEFFDAIETDERAQRRFLRDCRSPGG